MCRIGDSLRPSPYGSVCVSIINSSPCLAFLCCREYHFGDYSLVLLASAGNNDSPIFYVSGRFILALHPQRCEPPYSFTIIKTRLPSTVIGVAETRFDAHHYHFSLEGPWVKHFPLLKSHFVICENDDWGLGSCLECVRPQGSILRTTNRERKITMIKVIFDNKNAMVQPWNKHGAHTLT